MPITGNSSGVNKKRGPYEETAEERSKERSEDSDEDDGQVRHHLSTNVKSYAYRERLTPTLVECQPDSTAVDKGDT